MSVDFQPHLISEFKTGLHTYLQPWMRPADAFEPLLNGYIYRGVLNKRSGTSFFGAVDDGNPIMGIMQFQNETTGEIDLVVATTVNLYLWTDAGFVAFSLPSPFTGTILNFFNWANWTPTIESGSMLYFTNNKDPVATWDGTVTLGVPTISSFPTLTIDGSGDTITTCLDVKAYKNRLLYILPTLSSSGTPQNQSIFWSAINNYDNVIVDTPGNGGYLAAPTGDTIVSAEFLRDILIVFFTKSTWLFRYTGNDSQPFRWDRLNSTKANNSPYGTIAYDEKCTSIGKDGMISCDGVNVERYDVGIVDYYETYFQEMYYSQSFSQRYDNLSQAWILYVSTANTFPPVGSIAPGSDQALIYNFLEQTFSTYTFSVPMTCLGTYFASEGTAWQNFTTTWADTPSIWRSYGYQDNAPVLLGGDTAGNVYIMDTINETNDYDPTTSLNDYPVFLEIETTRWNTSIGMGQKTQFGWIDVYYFITSSDTATASQVTMTFFVDNSTLQAATRTLTLDGPANSSYTFKRIYLNLIGEFVQIDFDTDGSNSIEFVGFIIWTKPSGRLTSGITVS